AQGLPQRLHAAVFEKMNQLAEAAFIRGQAVGGIETAQAAAACGANPIGVQREGIQKRRLAQAAEELRA
ncbi:MAG TPA: hypothetical protein VIL86_11140, partial [Tepidisphaeraceae bacterium]